MWYLFVHCDVKDLLLKNIICDLYGIWGQCYTAAFQHPVFKELKNKSGCHQYNDGSLQTVLPQSYLLCESSQKQLCKNCSCIFSPGTTDDPFVSCDPFCQKPLRDLSRPTRTYFLSSMQGNDRFPTGQLMLPQSNVLMRSLSDKG